MQTKRILFSLLFICIAFSCEKEYYTTIPNYRVYLELNLALLDSELNAQYAYKIIDKPEAGRPEYLPLGFGGILAINGFGDSQVNIYAYDLSCPVEAQRDIHVIPDGVKTAHTATCEKCGAVFYISTGTGAPKSGSKYYLRSYKVSGDGSLNSKYFVRN